MATIVDARRHQQYAICLCVLGLFISILATGDGQHARAWSMGIHAGLTIVYAVQQHQFIHQLTTQCIGTFALLTDNRVVYLYVVLPMYAIVALVLARTPARHEHGS